MEIKNRRPVLPIGDYNFTVIKAENGKERARGGLIYKTLTLTLSIESGRAFVEHKFVLSDEEYQEYDAGQLAGYYDFLESASYGHTASHHIPKIKGAFFEDLFVGWSGRLHLYSDDSCGEPDYSVVAWLVPDQFNFNN